MQYERYKTILLRILGEDMVSLLKKSNAIIAGGSITSLFSQSQINDFDIYFRSKEDMIVFIRNAYKQPGKADNKEDLFILTEEQTVKFEKPFNITCQNRTDRSITFTQNGNTIQLIHFAYFQNADEIFESYDFHINMAAYDFTTDDFILHPYFLESVAARRLTFNEKTRYPIMSTLRVQKYIERGYTINRKEMFKIGLTCSMLNLDSWEKLIDQLSGFYGVNVSEIFDTTVPFTMEAALDMLDKVYELPESDPIIPNFEQIMFFIAGNPFEGQNTAYRFLNIVEENGKQYYKDESTGILFPTDGTPVNVQQTETWHKGMPIDYTIESFYPWMMNTKRVYALLQLGKDVEVTRGAVDYHVKGNVSVIGIRKQK